MAVMYGHRKILTQSEIEQYPKGVVNIHNSLLPWNRGAHPNFWSWYDDTPKGVTIHKVDAGLDTGDILIQMGIYMSLRETLSSSYLQLHNSAELLFDRNWVDIRNGMPGKRQPRDGSLHKAKELEAIFPHLSKGWDTTCKEVAELGRKYRNGLTIHKMDTIGG
jgi:methionyl-tRNA formyltransferase